MPAADPLDQRAAREFKQTLRDLVSAGHASHSMLEWFSALPKRVRRSRRLIDDAWAALKAAGIKIRQHDAHERALAEQVVVRAPSPRDLLSLQGDANPWAEDEPVPRQTGNIERERRLEVLRTQLRDLSCLRGDGSAWSSVGRRKKRYRAFRAIGRTFLLHQTLSQASATAVSSLEPTTVLHQEKPIRHFEHVRRPSVNEVNPDPLKWESLQSTM
ncbi:hypothetical protein BDV93DRAFT_265858 [Ceratobasidium sp. AG-I]|nr:hypothetical protein BDV93DRAFT_265858 [Ceratobasidium sp. AG-I]